MYTSTMEPMCCSVSSPGAWSVIRVRLEPCDQNRRGEGGDRAEVRNDIILEQADLVT